MLESFLKFSLSYKDTFDKDRDSPRGRNLTELLALLQPAFEHYDYKDLSYTINRSYKLGLITKKQEKQLHNFRQLLRNAYSHNAPSYFLYLDELIRKIMPQKLF